MKRALWTVCAVLIGASWGGPAAAHPGYPGVVDQTFGAGAAQKIAPPDGCQLCHTTSGGGTPLGQFGTILVGYGLSTDPVNEHDASLVAALQVLESMDPQLAKDIQNGTDPNTDTTTTSVQTLLPTPRYGCSVGRAPGSLPAQRSWWAIAALAYVLSRRRLRSSSEAAPLRHLRQPPAPR